MVTGLLAAGLVQPIGSAPPASADPLPATYSGSTDSNIVGLDVNLFGLGVTAGVGHTEGQVDSQGSPPSSADAANVDANALGLNVPVASVSETAPPDNGGPTTGSLGQVGLTGLLDTGLLTGTADAHWAGDTACPPAGTALTDSQVQLAGLTLGNNAVQVLQLGASGTEGTTSLVPNGGPGDSRSVVSTSSGDLSTVTLLNGAVVVNVAGTPTLTATASGSPGGASVTYSAPNVTVTALGNTITLQPGVATTISIPLVGSVTLTVGIPTVSTTADGQNAVGDVSLLTANVNLLGGLGTATVALEPLHAEAHAPAGGVQCALLDAPTITSPTDGSTTEDTTPTVTGTGAPGATVTVTLANGTVLGTTTVQPDGTWSLTPTDPLPLGAHTITAAQSTATATSPDSAPVSFTIVDTTAPAAPVITSPADGTSTNDATPTITGTAEPGSSVHVVVDGADLGTVTAGADGSWSIPVTTPLSDGSHTVTATATDASGNTSPAASSTFTVDTAVSPPVITSPSADQLTDDPTPTVSGTAEPGATVDVLVDGVVVGTTTADGTGSWSFTLPPQGDGAHVVTATQTDPAGNTSGPSDPVTITVDTSAPAAPVITSPADGTSTNDATPTITGTAEPGSSVHVVVDGADLGTVTAGADGSWSIPVTTPLSDGSHTVTATATDAAGNTGPTTTDTFTVDTGAPAAPVITGPADGSTVGTDSPIVTGTAEPGSTVTVVVDGTTYTTTADPVTGAWSVQTSGLPDGTIDVSATATDAAGNTSPTATSSFVVDTTADAPVITSPDAGTVTNDPTVTVTGTAEPGAAVTLTDENGNVVGTATADANGDWTITTTPLAEGPHALSATQTDTTGNTSPASSPLPITIDTTVAAPVVDPLPNGGLTDDATPTLTGTGEPGATVTVLVDGQPVRTTTVQPDGTWSLTPTAPLADGDHTVTATQTDVAGNVSGPSDPVAITVDTTAPGAPQITSIAPGDVLQDHTPLIQGTGEPGAEVTVKIDGQTVGTATVGSDGTWQLQVTAPLAAGSHVVTATQTDAAGNVSDATRVPFSVSTPSPKPPTVVSPGSTLDHTPTFHGTGTPGSTVHVVVDGAVLGTAVVGPNGKWSLTPRHPLSCGTHTLSAYATHRAARSATPRPATFTVVCPSTSGAGAAPGSTSVGAVSRGLPNTGAPRGLLGATLIGLLLLAGGAWLVHRGRV